MLYGLALSVSVCPSDFFLSVFSGIFTKAFYILIFRFRADQRIFVHGLGAYGISSPVPNTKFNVTATICKGQTILSSKNLDGSGRSYDFRMPFQVMFDKPIEVLPEEEYLLTAVLKVSFLI